MPLLSLIFLFGELFAMSFSIFCVVSLECLLVVFAGERKSLVWEVSLNGSVVSEASSLSLNSSRSGELLLPRVIRAFCIVVTIGLAGSLSLCVGD